MLLRCSLEYLDTEFTEVSEYAEELLARRNRNRRGIFVRRTRRGDGGFWWIVRRLFGEASFMIPARDSTLNVVPHEVQQRDPLMDRVLGCAIEVHRVLGPGLLESAYARCLAYELLNAGIHFREQVPVPVTYKRVRLECGYRLDFVIDNRFVLEIKTVVKLVDLHRAQLLTYMRLTGIEIGYLLNFNAPRLMDGVSRLRVTPLASR